MQAHCLRKVVPKKEGSRTFKGEKEKNSQTVDSNGCHTYLLKHYCKSWVGIIHFLKLEHFHLSRVLRSVLCIICLRRDCNSEQEEPIKSKKWKNRYLVPRVSFYLWKPKVCIIRIHTPNFLTSWSTKNLQNNISNKHSYLINFTSAAELLNIDYVYLDNLNKLVNSTFTRK